jgi:hypothetical protein
MLSTQKKLDINKLKLMNKEQVLSSNTFHPLLRIEKGEINLLLNFEFLDAK